MSKAIFKDVVIKTDYDGVVVAWFEYSGVDRTMTHGYSMQKSQELLIVSEKQHWLGK
jgi:hypothetical protein